MRLAFIFGMLLVLAVSVVPAGAQTIYRPTQYQYGREGEIFYGGQNPSFAANPYIFMPEVARNAGLVQQYGVNPYVPYSPAIYPLSTQRFGFASPSQRPTRFDLRFGHEPDSVIYSDLDPGEEVGQYGFTSDDARNEAYFNAPRYFGKQMISPTQLAPASTLYQGAPYQVVMIPQPGSNSPAEAPAAPADQYDPAKAQPLLAWAQNEFAAGHTAFADELVNEASRFDPANAEKMRAAFKAAPPIAAPKPLKNTAPPATQPASNDKPAK